MKVNNYQQWAKSVFGQCCYAACLSYLFRKSLDPIIITLDILNGIRNGFIDFEDAYVSKPLQYIQLIKGVKYRDVEKPKINSLADLPDGEWIVEYSYNKGSHFVIADKNGVTFDPAGDSNSVKFGKPVSYRRFIA